MILIINTADSEKVFLGLVVKSNQIFKKEFKAKYQQAEKLLVEIDKLIKANEANEANEANKLKAIIVVNGPGPFTALRVGVVTANTLAWALNIPVVGIKPSEFKNYDDLNKAWLRYLDK